MGSRNSALERALPVVAAAYGEQFGVDVVLSGADAYTDGKRIVLPMFAADDSLADVLWGYLAHEAAHVRDSDFSVIGLCNSAIEKDFLNTLEDFRIEKLIQEAFPGTQFTLDAMWKHCVEAGLTDAAQPDDNEANQLSAFLLYYVQTEGLGREVSRGLLEQSRKVVEATFPPGFFVRFDVLMAQKLHAMQSSRDALRLARDVLKALKQAEEEERQNQEQQQQGQDQRSQSPDQSLSERSSGQGESDNSQSTQDTSGSNGQSDEAKGDSAKANGAAGGSDAGSSKAQEKADKSDSSKDSGKSPSTPDSSSAPNGAGQQAGSGNKPSLHDQIQQETDIKGDLMQALREQFQDAASKEQPQGGNFKMAASDVGDQVDGKDGDADSLQSGLLASSAIRARLLGLLQAQTRSCEWLHRSGRKIDGKRLTRLETGSTRVFIKREEHHRPDTAVHVLLDTSGSMSSRQAVANQATVSLALAASTIPKVDIAVSMFPGVGGAVSPMVHRGQPVRPNIGRFAVRSSGGTPLADAMLYATRELVASHRERKVLIIITDGQPSNPAAVSYLNRLIAPEVDTYAIGIGTDAVRQFFAQWSVISDVRQLQNALFQIAGRFLDLH